MHNNNSFTVDLRKGAVRQVEVDVYEEPVPANLEKGSLFFRFLAVMILITLVGGPFARVYANEGDSVIEPELATEAPAPVSETVDSQVSEPAEPPVEEVVESGTDIPSEEVTAAEVQDGTQAETAEEVVSESDESVDEEVVEETEEVVTEETEEGDVLGEVASTTEEVALEEVPEEVIEEEPAQLHPAVLVPDPSQVVFSAKDCVTVSDDEFYCVKSKKSAPETSYALSESTASQDAFSQKDSEGDLEIYLTIDGGVRQITSNTTDDDAPAYDADSGRLAWHALVDGRYQIFVYDIHKQIARQITKTEYNNTNPSIDGGLVTWQGWEDDNWEVFSAVLDAGTFSDGDISISRISRNTEPDMFPKIHDRFITWQARVADAWRTQGYNTVTGEQIDLGEGTGGDVSSARLVLLVERTNDNGDIERVGYEVATGDAVDLGSEPSPISEESVPPTPIDGNAGSLPEVNANALKTVSRGTDGDADAGEDGVEPVAE